MNYITREDIEQLDKDFTYHPPINNQTQRYKEIRDTAKEFGKLICNRCPPSRERTLALSCLETTVMWANAAIARNEPEEEINNGR